MILTQLRDRFAERILETDDFRGDHTAVVDRGAILDILRLCKEDPGLRFEILMDLTAVDYL
ncbi:MAG: NADH-quinone oxidoreductase subunit C, partial [Candidatus Methylomirabilia bacterium]